MSEALAEEIKAAGDKLKGAKSEIGKVIVGQENLVDRLVISLLTDGHLLLEGLPGLAKTLSVTTLAKAINADFKRVQFTPDLLPADLIGTSIYNPKEGTFSVSKGPLFTNILLADEINRAPAKVQSALLEVMQERQITIAGTTYKTGSPYLVLATQNPIEQEGTYPLPEAQMDRFMMKVKIDYPKRNEEKEIINRMSSLVKKPEASAVLNKEEILDFRKLVNQVYVDPKIVDFILNIVEATRRPKDFGLNIQNLITYGASPRASLALIQTSKAQAFLGGRVFVTPQDIKDVAFDVLRHRIKRSYEAEAEDVDSDQILEIIFKKLLVP